MQSTKLHTAVGNNRRDVVEFLLEQEEDPNIMDENGDIPITIAIYKGYICICELLLEHTDKDLLVKIVDEKKLLSRLMFTFTYTDIHFMFDPDIRHIEFGQKLLMLGTNPNIEGIYSNLIRKQHDIYKKYRVGLHIYSYGSYSSCPNLKCSECCKGFFFHIQSVIVALHYLLKAGGDPLTYYDGDFSKDVRDSDIMDLVIMFKKNPNFADDVYHKRCRSRVESFFVLYNITYYHGKSFEPPKLHCCLKDVIYTY